MTRLRPAPERHTPDAHVSRITLDVRHLSLTEVPIRADAVEAVRAEGLSPHPYLLASGVQEGTTALVMAFDTARRNIHQRADARTSASGPQHLWILVEVEPDEGFRHPSAPLHAVLLDAFTSDAAIARALQTWSPATRVLVDGVTVQLIERDAALVLDAEGPLAHRLTSEYSPSARPTAPQSMRLLGVADHQVTGFIDLAFPERVRHAGHGIATTGLAHEPRFPPAAGLSRLERPGPPAAAYRLDVSHTLHRGSTEPATRDVRASSRSAMG